MQNFITRLVKLKVYIDRARAYYAYAQLYALFLLVLGVFHLHVSTLYLILGLPALLVVSVLIGWLDTRYGFFSAEAKRHSELNPVYNEMLCFLTRLEQRQINDQIKIARILMHAQANSMSKGRFSGTSMKGNSPIGIIKNDILYLSDSMAEKLTELTDCTDTYSQPVFYNGLKIGYIKTKGSIILTDKVALFIALKKEVGSTKTVKKK